MARIEIGGQTVTTDEIQDLLATDHPLVERFQFEREQGYGYSGGLQFALKIIPKAGARYLQQRDGRGRRVQPTWKTLTGHEIVGQGNRAIWEEGDELVAENCTFFPNQEFNDLGIGSSLYVAMERFYRHLGIRRVSLLAVDVGVYVWARQGFAFADGGAGGLVADLQRFVSEHHDETVSLERAQFSESWHLANYDHPGLTIDDYRVGKAFMLMRAPAWHGIKYLDDERHNEVAEASRRETFARLPDKIDDAPDSLAVR
jgi:hypothetical protein